jgi:hypothetical protein
MLWPKVTVINRQSRRTIVTDVPVVNLIRDKITQADKEGRPPRALEVVEILIGLSDPDL